MPGVVAVLTAATCRSSRRAETACSSRSPGARSLWAGQPVALVVAETPEAAADAAELVFVETSPLPAVVDLDRAVDPRRRRWRGSTGRSSRPEATAESQHAAVGGGAEKFTPDEAVSANVVGADRVPARRCRRARCRLATSMVEGRFTTSWVHQGYIEPQVAMAELDATASCT